MSDLKVEGKFYEKFYPGPFKEIPSLEGYTGGDGYDEEPAYISEDNQDISGTEWPYETEGTGSKFPAARK